jgi:phage repressor protein C with HTH and peptisase S24 domain
LAITIGVDNNTVSRWERDLFRTTGDYVPKIAAALNTSVAYLLGETNDPTRYPTPLEVAGGVDEGSSGNFPMHDMVKNIEDHSSALRKAAELTTQSKPKQEVESNIAEIIYPKDGFIKIPLLDLETCAGRGWSHDFVDIEVLNESLVPTNWVGSIDPERKPFMVIIRGNSMEEANLIDGCQAVINPAEDVYSGDSAMVCFGENRTVALKRVYYHPGGAIELRSASQGYPVITYSKEQQTSENDSLQIIGKVVAFSGKPVRG